jgi:hypothetical protein
MCSRMNPNKYPRDLNACFEESPLARVAHEAAARLFAFVYALPSSDGARTLRSLQAAVTGVAAWIAEGVGCTDADMQLCRYKRARLRALRCEGSAGVLRFTDAVPPKQLKSLLELTAALTRAVTALCESCVAKPTEVVVEPKREPRRTNGHGTPPKAPHGVQAEVVPEPPAQAKPMEPDTPSPAAHTDAKADTPD